MRESTLLAHIYDRSRGLAVKFPQVLVGPGHDCAAVALPPPGQVLLKVDQLVSGRHFRVDAPLDLVARKAVTRVISDIAASGGSPVAALAAATLPDGYEHADELFDALSRWALHFGAPLVGGDIARSTSGSLVLSVTGAGAPHPTRGPVLRSGVRPGDALYVTGALGGSFHAASGLGRHFTFEPRLAEARWLCDTLGTDLHAMMDVSDGLGRDTGRLADASEIRILIEARAIPLAEGVKSWRAAASDGEDYELLFAASGGRDLPPACPATGTPIRRIGMAESGSGVFIIDESSRYNAAEMGYEH